MVHYGIKVRCIVGFVRQANTMAADAVTPYVTKSSAAVVLTQ